LTGLDLGQIEHVVDQAEQVLAVAFEPPKHTKHLLGWLAVSAIRHQFAIAQDGV
jgi:hypothetical protein